MKAKYSTCIMFLLCVFNLTNAQNVAKTKKAVDIQKETAFNLTTVDSRSYIHVHIPDNTTEWFIAFTTTTDANAVNPIGLLAQIVAKMDRTGVSSIAAGALTTPNGTSSCNIEVTDLANRRKFTDLLSDYNYYDEISMSNATHGVIKVDGKEYNGDLEVLIYNPSFTTTINVSVEVTAITEEDDLSVWSKEMKDTLYNTYYNRLIKANVSDKAAGELASCWVSKISTQITPDDLNKMSAFEQDKLSKELAEKCAAELQGGVKSEEQQKGSTYGSLGWKAFENGDIDKCIEYSKKALTFDNTLGWVKSNLGLCYLIKNESANATDYYVEAISAISKDKITAKQHIEAAIKDIDDALKKYTTMTGYKEIRDILKSEAEKY